MYFFFPRDFVGHIFNPFLKIVCLNIDILVSITRFLYQ